MSRLRSLLRGVVRAAVVALPALAMATSADAQTKVRVALGDVLSTETLSMVIALERAKEKGVDYQITHFAKEDLAIQAVINGQADIGIGTPYAVMQKSKAPLRIVFQATRLVFFPVADKSYKTWKDLNGQPFTFHARGSGTEAIGNIIAKREGIQFGSAAMCRALRTASSRMINGQIKATIVDLANKNLLMEKAADRFHVLARRQAIRPPTKRSSCGPTGCRRTKRSSTSSSANSCACGARWRRTPRSSNRSAPSAN